MNENILGSKDEVFHPKINGYGTVKNDHSPLSARNPGHLGIVFLDRPIDRAGQVGLAVFGGEEGFFFFVGDEAGLDEDGGLAGSPEDEVAGLLHPTVYPADALVELVLHFAGQFPALFQVDVGEVLEEDVGGNGIGIEAFVDFLVIFFEKDDAVFAHDHVEVGVGFVGAEDVGFGTVGRFVVVGIAVNADEEVGFVFGDFLGAVVQFDESVVVAGHDTLLPAY